ncbi:MAG TPA: DEAD/DEAH box helicase [Pseudogracilibacillus sp.]|nr:DEAD/DEAH box helicase [Pseudogracilibacillus sp.]
MEQHGILKINVKENEMDNLPKMFKELNQLEASFISKDASKKKLFVPIELYSTAVKYRGKLLTKDELDIPMKKLNYLIKENYIKILPSIIRRNNLPYCLRCENNDDTYFANMDCKKCFKIHLYCRSCLQMNRVIECEPLYYWYDESFIFKEQSNLSRWSGKLSKAQQEGANQSLKALHEQTDLLIWAVTGSGKTELVFPVITKALEKGMRVCIASPRTDVVKEFRLRIESIFNKITIAALYANSEEKDVNAQLIITTNHQLLRFKRTFDLLIIDEVDAFPYSTDDRLKRITSRSRKKKGTTIYLTATPNPLLKKQPTVFIPKRYHGHPLIIPQVKYSYQLKKSLQKNKLPKTFNQLIRHRNKPQRQLLIFVASIRLSIKLRKEIVAILEENNLIQNKNQVQSVDSQDIDRSEKVNAFRKKDLYCLITTTILERGVTFPSVDVIVIGADNKIFTSAALVQISGRAGRSVNDPNGNVYFLVTNNTEAIKSCLADLKYMNQLAKEFEL